MEQSRRTLVKTLLGIAITAGGAGCLERSPTPAARRSHTATSDTPRAETDPTPTSTPSPVPTPPSPSETPSSLPTPSDPIRGEGPAELSASRTESDEDIEYLPDTEEVRYVARRSGNETTYKTMPFEDWGRLQCTNISADTARTHVKTELDVSDIGSNISDVDGHDSVVIVTISKGFNRDREVVHTPAVPLGDLVSVTPESVRATYTLEKRSYERTVPVYAKFSVWITE